MFSDYLKKLAVRPPFLSIAPNKNLGLVVVIPAYNEESLIPTLESLNNCYSAQKSVEVIVVFNAAENDTHEIIASNKKACKELKEWALKITRDKLNLHIIEEYKLPKKHAGVGLARKIGMDEAVRRFELLKKDGIIVCFDADSKCKENYLIEVESHFKTNGKTEACSIYFEHPIKGSVFEQVVYSGICFYELHLRYYKNGLAYANLPFAYHTIGSSMAVRASAYCKEGGMNKRKAGEDFYFLQKFISKGTLSEINSTTVFPSPRSSDRVPFGTGRAIKEMQEGSRDIEYSYAFETFVVLKDTFEGISTWYDEDVVFNTYFLEFVGKDILHSKLLEIRTQSSSRAAFVKRFFQWFNAFQTLKFVHFLRDNYFPIKKLEDEALKLLKGKKTSTQSVVDVLEKFREIDRS